MRTTEFWLTAVFNMAGITAALLAADGLAGDVCSELWLVLVQALALVVIPLALAYVNGAYIVGRAEMKMRDVGWKRRRE